VEEVHLMRLEALEEQVEEAVVLVMFFLHFL
jgi:hypothetical protein